MNILEYIESLMDQGMSEESASRCAHALYSDDPWIDEDEYDYDAEKRYWDDLAQEYADED